MRTFILFLSTLAPLALFACGSVTADETGYEGQIATGGSVSSGGSAAGMSGSSGHPAGGTSAGAAGANGGSESAGAAGAGIFETGGEAGVGGAGVGGSTKAGSSGAAGATGGSAGGSAFGGMGGMAAAGGAGATGGAQGGSTTGGAGRSQAGTGPGGTGGSGQNPCAGAQATAEVFGHSPDQLFKVDPMSLAVTLVGSFDCLGVDQMIDIALDKDGNMYGTSFGGFLRIDKTTAHCQYLQTGSYPNSLSFVPAGTVLPSTEALVGYNGSDYVLIDPSTGAVSTIGSLSGGYKSSGDIVSVIGGGTYLTVKGGSQNCDDCVVEVNPTTGDLVQVLGPANFQNVFGVAFWAGIVYGFTSFGQLFTYDVVTKQSMAVTIPNAPNNLVFYGAGSTTCAPAIKPLSALVVRRRCLVLLALSPLLVDCAKDRGRPSYPHASCTTCVWAQRASTTSSRNSNPTIGGSGAKAAAFLGMNALFA